MTTITLTNEYQVKQILQSIAANIMDFKANVSNSKAKDMILRDLLDLAINIEDQTSIKTYESTSIRQVITPIYITL